MTTPPAPSERLLPHPRELLRVGPHDRAHRAALRVALAVVVPLVVLALIGHLDWAAYAVFGAFAAPFGRNLARFQRLGMQVEAGLLLVACVVLGATLSALHPPVWLPVLVIGVVAGLASAVSDLRRWSPPGPLFFVFGLGVTAFVPATPASIGIAAVVSLAGLATALTATVAGAALPRGRRKRASPLGRRWSRDMPPLDGRRTALHAAICLAASIVAGLISIAVGLDHPYWAMVSAVVPVVGRSTSAQLVRAGHRLLGTLIGVAAAAALLSVGLDDVGLIVAFGMLQFGAEMAVLRHYGLTLVFITPMALGMPALTGPVDVGSLVLDRTLDTALGIAVVVIALLATHRLRQGPPAPRTTRAS
ncbi:FUSC family protein [Frigoribacterium sp. 2-23]|uniref:FUSC family protein n=1 Tax=Frigoribacterium sp. 2-23 TaxID=3415006 RepID=UPI003C6FB40C